MDKFIKEIESLSESVNSTGRDEASDQAEYKALSRLFEIAVIGADKYNESGSYPIKIHRLHTDLMPLFFNFQSDCSGFVIKTENKFIFIMQSQNDNILIYGLTSKNGVDIRQNLTRAIQLLNLEIKENNDVIKYYDKTNREIQAEEVVLQLFKWGLS